MGKLRIKEKRIGRRGFHQFFEKMGKLRAEGKIGGCGFGSPEKENFTFCCDCPYQAECNPNYQNRAKEAGEP